MTVKELIEELQKLDESLHVFVPGYEGGIDDVVVSSEEKDIALNVRVEWYYGKHELLKYVKDSSKYKITKGIILNNKTI